MMIYTQGKLTKDRSEIKGTNKISRNFDVKKLKIKSTSISVKFLYIKENSLLYNAKQIYSNRNTFY